MKLNVIKNANIRRLQEDDDLDNVTLMIRQAYKSLLEKGFKYWGTFQSVDDTKKRFSCGDAFVVELDSEIIGTITLKHKHIGPEETRWYDKAEICYFTQFAVKPEYQKSGLGSKMMSFIEDFAREEGFKEISLDTCENADSNHYLKFSRAPYL